MNNTFWQENRGKALPAGIDCKADRRESVEVKKTFLQFLSINRSTC